MYRNSCYPYQWHNPMHDYWNNIRWSNNWNGHYYNGVNTNGYPYKSTDYGQRPFVVNIDQATKQNNTYRTALWTGKHLQVTLMSINVGDDIGLEVHPTTDQFIRIEEGQGLVQMGESKDNLNFQAMACGGYAIMIPAGTWHNVTNTGNTPLKIYVIYAPPEHPYGTVHVTKADAMSAE
ncbi:MULTISPECIES: cupin domain-containing protein [Paenibacillus]|uniref:cupin domain-containing protein n=1 Tax=Paenibacillus TaxID=44249 RepID=UPI000472A491|nr:cupin domain-containing protein [Paenibacillus maysiensis]